MQSTPLPPGASDAPDPIRIVPAPADLLDEISFGVAELDWNGAVLSANPAAHALLHGVAGGRLATTLSQMAERVRDTEGHVEAVVRSPGSEVRLLVARTADGCLAYLERDLARPQRVQVQILRTMLAAICEDGSLENAASRSLLALAWVLPETHLVLYELKPDSETLVCLAQARVPPGRDARLIPQPLGNDSPFAQAAFARAPVHSLEPPDPDGTVYSVYVLPVKSGDRLLGVLYARGPAPTLKENELRLLQGLADATASLLNRARQEAVIQSERASRRLLEAEQDRARRIALEQEALATAGRLSACMAHEINGPLAFIRTNLNAMKEQVQRLRLLSSSSNGDQTKMELDEIAGEFQILVGDCLDGLDHIASVASILKGLSRAGPQDRIQFDPSRTIRDAIHMFRRARLEGGQVELELEPELPELTGSPVALAQVLLNLMENALDAMGGSGTISVRGIRTFAGLRLEVEDRGQGIPKEIQDRIYEPYFTTKAMGKGTGLGLYITRDIVKRMGGQIEFRSVPGRTIFSVELPSSSL